MHFAIRAKSEDIVELLVAYGANIRAKLVQLIIIIKKQTKIKETRINNNKIIG